MLKYKIPQIVTLIRFSPYVTLGEYNLLYYL